MHRERSDAVSGERGRAVRGAGLSGRPPAGGRTATSARGATAAALGRGSATAPSLVRGRPTSTSAGVPSSSASTSAAGGCAATTWDGAALRFRAPAGPAPLRGGWSGPPNAPTPGGYGYVPGPTDRFGRPLASWWQRFLGILLDWLILNIPKTIVAGIAIGSSNAGRGIYTTRLGVGLVVVGIVFAVIEVLYFALLNGSPRGQTVGQMALGIAVRDSETGGPIDPQRAGLRILVLIPSIVVDWIPIIGALAGLYTIIAGLSPLWDARRQGFHDKVAHTDVVRVR